MKFKITVANFLTKIKVQLIVRPFDANALGNLITQKMVGLVLGIFLLILLLITEFSFFTHFDFTDEGYYLHLLTQGSSATFLSPFYLLFHYVGNCFGHLLIGYRFLNLVLFIITAFILSATTLRFLVEKKETKILHIFSSLVMVPGFLMFFGISTFSYNSVASIASCMWAIGMIKYFTKPTVSPLVLVAFATLLAFTARPPFGLALFLSSPVFLWVLYRAYRKNFISQVVPGSWSGILLIIPLSIGLITAYVFLYSDILWRLIPLYQDHLHSTHANLIGRFTHDLKPFLKYCLCIFVEAAFFLIITKFSTDRKLLKLDFLIPLVGLTALFIQYDFLSHRVAPEELIVFIVASVFVVAIMNLINIGKQFVPTFDHTVLFLQKRFYLTLLAFFPALISGIGTAENVFVLTGYSSGLLFMPIAVLLFDITRGFRKNNIYALMVAAILMYLSFFILKKQQIYSFYRNGSYHTQIEYSKLSHQLKYIKIEPDIARNIDSLLGF